MKEHVDAAKFYALLRFEEASLALRAVLRIGLVDQMGARRLSQDELRIELGFTEQAARTFFTLLQVMEILERDDQQKYRVTKCAADCLAGGVASSRKPYLAMGTDSSVDALIDLLRGNQADDALPLYSGENAGDTVMDDADAAREIAFGLASRARNFAAPLASAMSQHTSSAKILADIGAGSPFVAQACLKAMPALEKAILVDRSNGMRFVREILQTELSDPQRLECLEADFFEMAPAADVYVLSNTAHDWREQEYRQIMNHVHDAISMNGLVCIHEPILITSWKTDSQWRQALWMACYALTLFRYTLGQGTCYALEEHHEILGKCGFQPVGDPIPTSDGCTALFYRAEL